MALTKTGLPSPPCFKTPPGTQGFPVEEDQP